MPNQPSSSEIRMSEFRIFQHLKGVGKWMFHNENYNNNFSLDS